MFSGWLCGLLLVLSSSWGLAETVSWPDGPGWVRREIQPGLMHARWEGVTQQRPQILQVLHLRSDHPTLRIQFTATDVWGKTRMPVDQLAREVEAVAAINGGFAPGRRHQPVGYGPMMFSGRVWPFVKDPAFHPEAVGIGRHAVGMDRQGQWHFRARHTPDHEAGDELSADWQAAWPADIEQIMSGGTRLVASGQVYPLITEAGAAGIYRSREVLRGRVFNRHPRTALGVTEAGEVLLVTVDGRHAGRADGMTLEELATLLQHWGCREAIEFDGGGSTTMWLRDAPGNGVVNYPTDNKAFDHLGTRSLRLAVLVMDRRAPQGSVGMPALKPDWQQLFEGVDRWSFHKRLPQPIEGYAVRIDTQAPGIGFAVSVPHPDWQAGEREVRSQTIRQFIREQGVALAINASTFHPVVAEEGRSQDVRGLQITAGREVSAAQAGRPALALTQNSRPFLLEPDAPVTERADAWHAVAGYGTILREGHPLSPHALASLPAQGLHPRTALGIDRTGRYLYALVIDGRQPGYSEGVDLLSLAHLLRELGAHEGLNMDGGGSTALAVRAADGLPVLVNRPIHGGRPGAERPNANHLGVFARPLPVTTE